VTKPAAFTPRARSDLGEAATWIARDSRSAASAFREAIDAVAKLVGEHPRVGVLRSDLAPAPYRFCVVRGFPYLVVYDASQEPPVVARIVHGARNLAEVLKRL